MSGKYNARFPKLKFMKNQSKSKKQKFLKNESESSWVWVGGSMVQAGVEIIWVVVKMDNGIIGDFKIGIEMMKWRW